MPVTLQLLQLSFTFRQTLALLVCISTADHPLPRSIGQVLGICKDVALVMVGVVFLGESVSQLQLMGYMLCLSGFCWYNYIKMAPTSAASTQLHGSGTAGSASGTANHQSSSRGDHNGHSHIGVEEPLLKQVLRREERGETKPRLDTQEHNNAAGWRL